MIWDRLDFSQSLTEAHAALQCTYGEGKGSGDVQVQGANGA